MRLLGCVVWLSACTSSAHPSPPLDPANTLTCSASVVGYCAQNRCDRTLAVARQDKSLCPATITRCGNLDVITHTSIDVATSWYYRRDQLVAIVNLILPVRRVCLAGPERFQLPVCTAPARRLPVCGP